MNNFMSGYPYGNAHELNLDWIISVIQELPETIKKEVAKQIDNIAFYAVYEADTETITFTHGKLPMGGVTHG